MIIDTLKNAHKYYGLNSGLEKAFNFLKTADLENIAPGSYEVDGQKVVALIQEYTTMDDPPWESHNYHIDVQYLISGVEKIGYHPVNGMKPTQPYNVKDDYDLLEKVDGDYLTLKDDIIMILFPEDGHLPRLVADVPMPVKKVVIKVLI
ncbi:YhcH/YjgK/YiaL family protein [Natranaerovirga hydrolytica]|uniref:YhcH/YjgK/YiaL family protein n=1 Tax=Natranaerovirga hydrolytica TaxID=680378 RepID=A0A4R1N391_9FIRM|nr:YhcH/YjgK/YiaL family protein [Natranaerovirga hydrolytica]TCK98504.1 YhcH/YjgK/YiaL family protein [Natranaerovirga hydrolytica]